MSAQPASNAVYHTKIKTFYGGKLVLGPDAKNLLLTLAFIITPLVVFCTFTGRQLTTEFSDHAGVSIMVVAVLHTSCVVIVLLLTAVRDPGILPRKCGDQQSDSGENEAGKGRLCPKCDVNRPLALRSSHCSICDNCVERFDHHCPWLGQCIARRNYLFFYMFIILCTLLCFFVIAMCAVHIKKLMDMNHGYTIWKAFQNTPASVLLMVYGFLASWFVGGLSTFHTYLISTNQTTLEYFRPTYPREDKGIMSNFRDILFSGIPPSRLRSLHHQPPNGHTRLANRSRDSL